jgi:hypothetical protein
MNDPTNFHQRNIDHLKEHKVFGIGFSKTGTTSLEQALLNLGLNVCRGVYNLKHSDYNAALYVSGLFNEIHRMTTYWDAFADGPWGGTDLYEKLVVWYPKAYFIHTVRDQNEWYESLSHMICKIANIQNDLDDIWDKYHSKGMFGSALFFQHIFQGAKITDKSLVLEYYNALNKKIEKFFSSKKYNYLKINITAGEGWEKVGPFLNVSTTETSFPMENVKK